MAGRIARTGIRSMNNVAEFTKNSIFIHGLGWRTGRGQLEDYFGQFGKVEKIFVHMNHYKGMSRGYAHLKFKDQESQSAALSNLNHYVDGHPIIIKAHDDRNTS